MKKIVITYMFIIAFTLKFAYAQNSSYEGRVITFIVNDKPLQLTEYYMHTGFSDYLNSMTSQGFKKFNYSEFNRDWMFLIDNIIKANNRSEYIKVRIGNNVALSIAVPSSFSLEEMGMDSKGRPFEEHKSFLGSKNRARRFSLMYDIIGKMIVIKLKNM